VRILISLSYYAPNISGLTNCAKILAEELAKKGHRITVMTSKHNKDLPELEVKDGIKILRVPINFKIGKGPIMLSFPFRASRCIAEADVVNCHLPQFESFMLAILAKIKNKRLILTYQTDLSWNGGFLLKISKISILMSHLISGILADRIIASSKDYAEISWFLKLFKRKLSYIYPPVKLIKLSKAGKNLPGKLAIIKKKYKIGFLGRISSEKGIEYLLETTPFLLNRLGENFAIIIAGPKPIGEDVYWNRIKILSGKYKKFIKFIGELNEEELNTFYKTLDVLVLPSVNNTEAFGMTQTEAMLNGVPVVVSNLPGVRVPVKETGMGEIAEPRDSKDLAEKTFRILSDRRRYVGKISNARKIFLENDPIEAYEKLLIGKCR